MVVAAIVLSCSRGFGVDMGPVCNASPDRTGISRAKVVSVTLKTIIIVRYPRDFETLKNLHGIGIDQQRWSTENR